MENMEHGLTPSSLPSSDISPAGSQDNLDQYSSQHSSLSSQQYQTNYHLCDQTPSSLENSEGSRKSSRSENDPVDTSSSEILRDIIQQKKKLIFGHLTSFDSEAESEAQSLAASDTGSITTNTAFQRNRGIFSSFRSAMSDTELEENVSF